VEYRDLNERLADGYKPRSQGSLDGRDNLDEFSTKTFGVGPIKGNHELGMDEHLGNAALEAWEFIGGTHELPPIKKHSEDHPYVPNNTPLIERFETSDSKDRYGSLEKGYQLQNSAVQENKRIDRIPTRKSGMLLKQESQERLKSRNDMGSDSFGYQIRNMDGSRQTENYELQRLTNQGGYEDARHTATQALNYDMSAQISNLKPGEVLASTYGTYQPQIHSSSYPSVPQPYTTSTSSFGDQRGMSQQSTTQYSSQTNSNPSQPYTSNQTQYISSTSQYSSYPQSSTIVNPTSTTSYQTTSTTQPTIISSQPSSSISQGTTSYPTTSSTSNYPYKASESYYGQRPVGEVIGTSSSASGASVSPIVISSSNYSSSSSSTTQSYQPISSQGVSYVQSTTRPIGGSTTYTGEPLRPTSTTGTSSYTSSSTTTGQVSGTNYGTTFSPSIVTANDRVSSSVSYQPSTTSAQTTGTNVISSTNTQSSYPSYSNSSTLPTSTIGQGSLSDNKTSSVVYSSLSSQQPTIISSNTLGESRPYLPQSQTSYSSINGATVISQPTTYTSQQGGQILSSSNQENRQPVNYSNLSSTNYSETIGQTSISTIQPSTTISSSNQPLNSSSSTTFYSGIPTASSAVTTTLPASRPNYTSSSTTFPTQSYTTNSGSSTAVTQQPSYSGPTILSSSSTLQNQPSTTTYPAQSSSSSTVIRNPEDRFTFGPQTTSQPSSTVQSSTFQSGVTFGSTGTASFGTIVQGSTNTQSNSVPITTMSGTSSYVLGTGNSAIGSQPISSSFPQSNSTPYQNLNTSSGTSTVLNNYGSNQTYQPQASSVNQTSTQPIQITSTSYPQASSPQPTAGLSSQPIYSTTYGQLPSVPATDYKLNGTSTNIKQEPFSSIPSGNMSRNPSQLEYRLLGQGSTQMTSSTPTLPTPGLSIIPEATSNLSTSRYPITAGTLSAEPTFRPNYTPNNSASFTTPNVKDSIYLPSKKKANPDRSFVNQDNVLVVDDYEVVPENLKKRIEAIAERSGARAKIVTVTEEETEEDREIDELMRRVFERVGSFFMVDRGFEAYLMRREITAL
jgi:hypothetical protein